MSAASQASTKQRRFDGVGALVTGAGHGIGAEVARRLAAEGACVGLLDRDGKAALDVAKSITESGGKVLAYEVDVSVPNSVTSVVAKVAADLGSISVLANCAGVVRYGNVVDLSVDDWNLQIGTNLTGAFLMCRAVIPLMRDHGSGSIVSVASVQAIASQPLVAAYSASKGGLVSLTKTVALDHAAEQIRANCVCPGSIETPMLRYGAETFAPGAVEETMQAWGKSHPLGFLGQPSDVASSILFLLSDDARFVTGAALNVDGGLLARLAV